MGRPSSGTCDAMGSNSAERRSVPRRLFGYDFVLPNKRGDRLLGETLPDGVGKLPRTELPSKYPRNCDPHSNDELEMNVETNLGICVHIVRELSDIPKQRKQGVNRVVDMNYIYLGNVLSDEKVIKKPFEWIQRETACRLKWVSTNEDEGEVDVMQKLKAIFEEMNGERGVLGVKRWEEIGWFEEVTGWIRQMLKTRAMVVEGKVRKVCGGYSNYVMKFEVREENERETEKKEGSGEAVFVKCTSPLTKEVERTVAIAGILKDIVPEIIGVDEREGLLMQRNGGEVTDELVDQEALFNTMLNMHELSMSHIEELEAGGLRIRDCEWLESNVESILEYRILDEYGKLSNWTKVCDEELLSFIPEIRETCRKVRKLGLPRTIVHGDLYPHNIGSPVAGCNGKVYRIFDWAKSCISNPLFDIGKLLCDAGYIAPGDSRGNTERAFTQVCKHWKQCEALTLEELESLCSPLGRAFAFIEINALSEQFDSCEENDKKEKDHIFRELEQLLHTTLG